MAGTCPRCEAPLGGAANVLACPKCGGVFVGKAVLPACLDALRSGQEMTFFASAYRTAPPSERLGGRTGSLEVRYLQCPVCGRLMNRKRPVKRLDCTVDVCMGDGVWFDVNELGQLATYMREQAKEKREGVGLDLGWFGATKEVKRG